MPNEPWQSDWSMAASRIIERLWRYLSLCLLCLVIQSHNSVYAGQFRTGSFSIELPAHEVFDDAEARKFDDFLSRDKLITWEIHVPETYQPESAAGVLTYISPTRSGVIPQDWKQLMSDRNLIWIGANRTGNNQPVEKRSTYAVLGAELMGEIYKVDRNRIYVTGFSGGGRIASMVVLEFPELFKGAIFICGVNFWIETPRQMELTKRNRYVFLTGTNDFNYQDTRNVYSRFRKAEIPNIKFLSITGMGHRLPTARRYGQAIAYLDAE